MSLPGIPRGPGLYEFTDDDGDRAITNVRKLAGSDRPPGRILVNVAAGLLGVLDLGLFAVSLSAQYHYILSAKHIEWPAVIEAAALDAGMIVFSLLALGLARGRQAAPIERALIVLCALASAGMNYAAADVSSARSTAAYVMPPVFLAIVTDRVIAVVRRHMLGMEAERSAWAVLGRAALVVLAAAGKAVLYGLRLVLAPRSTFSGARTLVLLATPLPGAHVLVREDAQLDAARAALGTVRTAIDDDLCELRDRHELTAAHAGDSLRAVQETVRTETQAVRETLRTQIEAVREAARTEAPGAVRAALGEDLRELRAALDSTLGELREHGNVTAAGMRASLLAVQEAVRTETEAVRDSVRTETDGVREAVRTGTEAVRETIRAEAAGPAPKPGAVDRDAVVAGLAAQIRSAMSGGGQWTPAYSELMSRTGYSRSWCEKAVRDARTQVFNDPDGTGEAGDALPGEERPPAAPADTTNSQAEEAS